jgi:hypothetical protein
VSEYRVFVLDSKGKVTAGLALFCADDATAMIEGKAMLTATQRAEVWQGSRMVGVVEGPMSHT